MSSEVKTGIIMSLIVATFYLTIAIVAPLHPDYRGQRRSVQRSAGNAFWAILVGNCGIFFGTPRMRELVGPFDAPIGVAVLGLFVGLILWILREKRRVLYGQLEIGFSILSLIWIGFNAKNIGGFQSSISFFGAVYVFVRGLSNIADADKASRAGRSNATSDR